MDANDWDDRYAGRDLVWSAGPNRFVAEHTDDLTPGRALDLACGEGRNAIWLAEQGWEVTGVDFSGVAIEKAQSLADHRGVQVDWQQHDLTTWVPEPGAYDLVVIAYLQLPAEVLAPIHRRAAAAVAPGGRLLLVAHERENLERGVGGPPSPHVLLTAEQLREDLAGTELEIDIATQVHRPVETPDGQRAAIDLLVMATRPA